MDLERVKRQLLAQADGEIRTRMRVLIEEQYYPVHGQFAAVSDIEGELAKDPTLRVGYTVCCEGLGAQVRQALGAES